MTEAMPLSNLINNPPSKKHPNLLSYLKKTKIFHIEIPTFFIQKQSNKQDHIYMKMIAGKRRE